MKLVTFGCSYVWGDELIPNTPEYRNLNNIGGIIYKNHKFDDYINFAVCGASNERILLQILEYKNSKYYSEDDFILVGLSGLSRKLNYINIYNQAFTIPHWNNMHLTNFEDEEFVNWFNLDKKINLNYKNQLTRYGINLLAIKSAISDNKYIVFQSIDDVDFSYDSVTKESYIKNVPLKLSTIKNQTDLYSTVLFEKEKIKKEILKSTNKNQLWLNFDYESWFYFIKNKHQPNVYETLKKGNHPSELGHQIWYRDFLKKYIENII